MPSEVRMSQSSFDGIVDLTFTNEMVVPGNFTAILNDRNKKIENLTVVSKENVRNLSDKPKTLDYLQLVMLRSE